jgi:branched-chain amino acid transport system permease protein
MTGPLSQTTLNVMISASEYVLIGLGFGLVYRAGRFFHLAHGSVFTAGAYAGWLLHVRLGCSAWLAFPTAIVLAAALGPLLWFGVYRPIRRIGGDALALFIGGLGADLVLQNAISLAFGDGTLQVRSAAWGRVVGAGGGFISIAQAAMVLLAVLACGLVVPYLSGTKAGRDIRAVGDSPELAAAVGINAEAVLVRAFLLASIIVAAAGLLAALDTDMRPTMGLQPLLLGITASVVGGTRGIWGLVTAALVLALVQHGGAWFMPSSWATPVALVALLLTLCLRPHGLWSARRRLE